MRRGRLRDNIRYSENRRHIEFKKYYGIGLLIQMHGI